MQRRVQRKSLWPTEGIFKLATHLIQMGAGRIVRATLAKFYELCFAVALLIPARSKRLQRERARRFALKVRENTEKHGAFGVALLINAGIVSLLGMTGIQRPQKAGGNSMEATVDVEGFLTRTTPQPKPPAGGGGGGAENLTFEVTAPRPETMAPITTVAPAAVEFSVPQATMPSLPSDLLKPASANTAGQTAQSATSGKGTGSGTGNGSGIGQGSGSGSGGGNGSGIGSGNGPAENSGEGRASTLRGLKNWNLVVIVDQSDAVGDGSLGYSEEITYSKVYENGSRHSRPTKINAILLPNILAQKNTLIEVVPAGDDNMFPNAKDRGPKYKNLYNGLGEAVEAILPKYAGANNTAVVLGSEFQWQANEVPKEERERMKNFLLSLKIPIFFVSLGAKPDQWHSEVARKSGGGYLGFLGAREAKHMAKNVDRVWTAVTTETGDLVYEKRDAKAADSEEILPGLGDSQQEGLSYEQSVKKNPQ